METSDYNSTQDSSFVSTHPQSGPQPVKPRWKRHRWGAFMALALLVGVTTVFYVIRNGSGQVQAAAATIEVTGASFSPQTIKIKKGQSVTWVNQDTTPHQVMANPYPTGTSLPSLNSTEPMVLGESYTATFDKTGTYAYHDPLNPAALNGVVMVEE
jgi:plastocyanin